MTPNAPVPASTPPKTTPKSFLRTVISLPPPAPGCSPQDLGGRTIFVNADVPLKSPRNPQLARSHPRPPEPLAGHPPPLNAGGPLSGAFVRIHSVVQILDRSAVRDNHGFVSHDTMNVLEAELQEFLDLP
jgi:hypothetical protein